MIAYESLSIEISKNAFSKNFIAKYTSTFTHSHECIRKPLSSFFATYVLVSLFQLSCDLFSFIYISAKT